MVSGRPPLRWLTTTVQRRCSGPSQRNDFRRPALSETSIRWQTSRARAPPTTYVQLHTLRSRRDKSIIQYGARRRKVDQPHERGSLTQSCSLICNSSQSSTTSSSGCQPRSPRRPNRAGPGPAAHLRISSSDLSFYNSVAADKLIRGLFVLFPAALCSWWWKRHRAKIQAVGLAATAATAAESTSTRVVPPAVTLALPQPRRRRRRKPPGGNASPSDVTVEPLRRISRHGHGHVDHRREAAKAARGGGQAIWGQDTMEIVARRTQYVHRQTRDTRLLPQEHRCVLDGLGKGTAPGGVSSFGEQKNHERQKKRKNKERETASLGRCHHFGLNRTTMARPTEG